MDLVIPLNWTQTLREEGDRVPRVVLGRLLRESGSRGKVRSVGLHSVHPRVIREGQNRGRGNLVPEFLKRSFLILSPLPLHFLLCEVEQGSSMQREILDEMPIEIGESQNDCTSFRLLGIGHSVTPQTLTGSTSTFPSEMISPRYSMRVCSNSHFSFLK